MLSHKPTKFV